MARHTGTSNSGSCTPGLKDKEGRCGVVGTSGKEKRIPIGSCGRREGISNLNLPYHLFIDGPQTKSGFPYF